MSSVNISREEFMDFGERVLKECANYYYETLDSEVIAPPLNSLISQNEIAAYENQPLPEKGEGERVFDCLPDFFRNCYHVNGRSFGFVYASSVPVAALADLLASVVNQNVMASFLTGAASTIERTTVKWMSKAIGCEGYCGTMTSGASMSNMMGMAIAREAKVPANQLGIRPESRQAVFYASKGIHMSFPKAVSLLGLGRRSLRLLELEDGFHLSAATVLRAIVEDRKSGKRPVAIIASAGTTGTGSVDRLQELADLAEAEGLWLHVDGAYGAFAAMVKPEMFKGLNRADSISLDGHKWLNMPVDCGCLLVRKRPDAIRAFSYVVDYICSPAKHRPSVSSSISEDEDALEDTVDDSVDDDGDDGDGTVKRLKGVEVATYEETIELSRRFRAFKIWFALRFHGMGAFRNVISTNIAQAQLLAQLVFAHPDMELMAPVDLSVVCFRVVRYDGATIPEHLQDEYNREMLHTLSSRGRYYFSKVFIRERFCLRACIINHLTTNQDVEGIPQEIVDAGKETLVKTNLEIDENHVLHTLRTI